VSNDIVSSCDYIYNGYRMIRLGVTPEQQHDIKEH